jgi:outer membrane protein OmpA-like peptidoglycan-associated protein
MIRLKRNGLEARIRLEDRRADMEKGTAVKALLVFGLIGIALLGGLSCSSWSKAEKGTVIGGATGAVVGGVIGDKAGNTAVGAILGAAIGGAAGAYIGDYMDKQANDMEGDLEGAKIERVGEGIKITFDSGILFDIDKDTLRPASQEQLTKMAAILNKYPDTNILLEGHTDATGSDEHNLDLSRRRARSVSNYLGSLAVSTSRMTIMGYGESQPIATNDTDEGRQLNRRVEVAVYANEELKEQAKQQTGG